MSHHPSSMGPVRCNDSLRNQSVVLKGIACLSAWVFEHDQYNISLFVAQCLHGDNWILVFLVVHAIFLAMKPTQGSKENATVKIRVFPNTHRKLKMEAARLGLTLAHLIDSMVLAQHPKRISSPKNNDTI